MPYDTNFKGRGRHISELMDKWKHAINGLNTHIKRDFMWHFRLFFCSLPFQLGVFVCVCVIQVGCGHAALCGSEQKIAAGEGAFLWRLWPGAQWESPPGSVIGKAPLLRVITAKCVGGRLELEPPGWPSKGFSPPLLFGDESQRVTGIRASAGGLWVGGGVSGRGNLSTPCGRL